MTPSPPSVLCFSGHDPSGGAGIQADIETLISHRCHPCSVITCLTEQDSRNVKKLLPQRAEEVIAQAQTLLADIDIAAIKIGLLGSAEIAHAIAELLRQQPGIPVIFDPILAAGGGTALANSQLQAVMLDELLPLTTVLTPNSEEARKLAQLDDLNACGAALQQRGAQFVLITGAHEQSDLVDNRLFMPEQRRETFHWQRLPFSYHGSGCTLASAIAGLMAQGLDAFSAINEAQEYTWQSLAAAYRPGQGQHNPQRLFWLEST